MLTESYSAGSSEPKVRSITLGQLLSEAAEECPDRAALIAGVADPALRREWTYAQLRSDAETLARALTTKFSQGEHIAIMAPNIPEWVLMEFGSAMAGLVLVTVNPSYQPEEIEYVLKQSNAVGIFVLPEFRGNKMLESVQQVSANCPTIREIVSLANWSELMHLGQDQSIELPEVKPDDACMIQYTSGTTGFPKGALLHHKGLVNNAAHVQSVVGLASGSIHLTMVPLFHTSGCVLGTLGPVANRHTHVLLESFDPSLVLELIETYGINGSGGVPTMLVALMEHPDFATRDLSSLRKFSAGGAPVPPELVKRFEESLGIQFVTIFGLTECSPVISLTDDNDTIEDKANTIGRPLPNVEVKIVDAESGQILPVNSIGEYCARGYNVMHGYYEMPEATAAAIDKEGWLHTGDLCSMDERGYVTVEGRLKDMIIRGGENVYPREIENALFEHPAIGEVAVVGLPDKLMGEVIGAFIRWAPGQQVEQQVLFAYLRERLSPQKTPSLWYFVKEFPLTGSGKIQKFELRKMWEAGQFS
ncbi:MAG: fatty-acyl-CoA synthase [Dinoroseobacter sp.]|jgi:fatty-acyl-CoA synthase